MPRPFQSSQVLHNDLIGKRAINSTLFGLQRLSRDKTRLALSLQERTSVMTLCPMNELALSLEQAGREAMVSANKYPHFKHSSGASPAWQLKNICRQDATSRRSFAPCKHQGATLRRNTSHRPANQTCNCPHLPQRLKPQPRVPHAFRNHRSKDRKALKNLNIKTNR